MANPPLAGALRDMRRAALRAEKLRRRLERPRRLRVGPPGVRAVEFGSGGTPPAPFIRPALDAASGPLSAAYAAALLPPGASPDDPVDLAPFAGALASLLRRSASQRGLHAIAAALEAEPLPGSSAPR